VIGGELKVLVASPAIMHEHVLLTSKILFFPCRIEYLVSYCCKVNSKLLSPLDRVCFSLKTQKAALSQMS